MLASVFDKSYVDVKDLPVGDNLICFSDGLAVDGVFAIDTLKRCVHKYKLDKEGHTILNGHSSDVLKEVVYLDNFTLVQKTGSGHILIHWD